MVAILPQINEINELPKSVMDIPSKTYKLRITGEEKKIPVFLNYIQSTGIQWIDTGIRSQIGIKVQLELAITGSGRNYIFGNELSSGTIMAILDMAGAGGLSIRQNNRTNNTRIRLNIDEKVTLEGYWTNNLATLKINGHEITRASASNSTFGTENLKIFKTQSSDDYNAQIKLYSCKMWLDNELIRDFIPVLDINGEPCLYDKISELFFHNSGSGVFIPGEKIGLFYKYRYYQDSISGFVDNLDAVKQAVYKILMTERYAYLIYSNDYGVELEQYIGKDFNYLQATIENTLRDALTYDLRIKDIEITNIENHGDSALIKFNVYSIYGDIPMEVNISV